MGGVLETCRSCRREFEVFGARFCPLCGAAIAQAAGDEAFAAGDDSDWELPVRRGPAVVRIAAVALLVFAAGVAVGRTTKNDGPSLLGFSLVVPAGTAETEPAAEATSAAPSPPSPKTRTPRRAARARPRPAARSPEPQPEAEAQPDAEPELDPAPQPQPDRARFFVSLGDAHRAAGRRDEAAASYARALELDPDNAAARRRWDELNAEPPGDL